jgi:hypothetical protein
MGGSLKQISATVTIAGSILFLVAAFLRSPFACSPAFSGEETGEHQL